MTNSQNIYADVLIVTVTRTESQAVLQIFKEATEQNSQSITIGDRTYRDLGMVNGSKVFMAISEMGASGLGAAQQAVHKAIQALNPHAVIMVGIAFGMNKTKQALGDILVSKQLMLYESQRLGKGEIIARGDRPHCSASLLNYLSNAHLDWDGAEVHFGLILTGEKLIDDLDYRKSLKELETEAIGGEMEGSGLYVSCQDAKVDWILVKAICDWADGNKNQDKKQRQAQAAKNAAEFVVHALQHATLPRLDKQTKPNSESQHLSTEVKDSKINGNVITASNIDNSFNKTEIKNYYDQKNIESQLSYNWFKSHIETSISDLGHRYTQEINFELDIAKSFDALSRNDKFREHFRDEIHNFLKNFKQIDNEFSEKHVVKGFIELLNNQFNIVQDSSLLNIDIESIQRNIKLIK
jgi:nucleoside phosphorylase